MFSSEALITGIVANWPIWTVSTVLVLAAVIDGIQLKVPNWITFPMIATGWVYSSMAYQLDESTWWVGLGWSLMGTAVGLALLLPAYAIGGMGAGDVKLLAGVGAWVHATDTFYAFAVSAIVGGLIALGMIAYKQSWHKHTGQFFGILHEISSIKNPETLATIAAERKSRMFLLPYGIPIAIGTIGYFMWMGMFL
jgi:prepilin peptidase CpaA